jgi:CRP-like cAMP-binding protein
MHDATTADRRVMPVPALHASQAAPRGDGRPIEANHLLRLLAVAAPAEYDALLQEMEPVALARRTMLHEPGEPIPCVYFPRTSAWSLVRIMANGRRVEVGTTGQEGMVGLPVFLDSGTMPFQCFVQIEGSEWRLPAHAFLRAAAPGRTLHRIVQRYTQYLFDQAARAVACNRLHAVDRRCARWLLMSHDRVGQAERFPLTHEFLAIMLGVRRASVSVTAEALQGAGLIRYRRGIITVVDRPGLEVAACECYQDDRDDYERLLGRSASWG